MDAARVEYAKLERPFTEAEGGDADEGADGGEAGQTRRLRTGTARPNRGRAQPVWRGRLGPMLLRRCRSHRARQNTFHA